MTPEEVRAGEQQTGPAPPDPPEGDREGGGAGPISTVQGMIREMGGGRYLVATDDGRLLEATLRGRLKRKTSKEVVAVIGDRVGMAVPPDGPATIEVVHPRSRVFQRRGPGGREAKVLAANLDLLVLVMAAADPEPARELVDRFLVGGEANGLPSILLLNKVDLEGARATAELFRREYSELGYPVMVASAATGEGLSELSRTLASRTAALVGPSGVGKSSLLNAMHPGLDLRIGALSSRRRTGRHTTVQARLLALPGGILVADTPGLSDMGIWGVEADRLGDCFPEFRDPADSCRFRSCTHSHEPGCGVKTALEAGEIRESRYLTYLRLLAEASGS